MLHSDFAGIVVAEMRLSDMDGLQFLEFARGLDTDLPIIMLAEPADMRLAAEAMDGGAYDVIEKPFSPARLLAIVKRALEKRRLTLELERLRQLHIACPSVPTGANLSKTVENFERALIAAELERQFGNVARSSQALGVARTTLHDKIRKYGLS
jgi:DNA-binding NtrC family response regulator